MKHVHESWRDFLARVIPEDAGDVQVQEMRRAYYAGGWATFQAVLTTMSMPEAPGRLVIDQIEKEFRAFAADVARGRA